MFAALPDLFAFVGAVLMAYGAWLVYPPAGYLLGGLFLLAVGIVGIWRRDTGAADHGTVGRVEE